ncbi:MAG: hypothetical protein IBX55_01085 [Methyloprofundus sp.]|nr:hypothetical protein [Methyloprofundus sp.]
MYLTSKGLFHVPAEVLEFFTEVHASPINEDTLYPVMNGEDPCRAFISFTVEGDMKVTLDEKEFFFKSDDARFFVTEGSSLGIEGLDIRLSPYVLKEVEDYSFVEPLAIRLDNKSGLTKLVYRTEIEKSEGVTFFTASPRPGLESLFEYHNASGGKFNPDNTKENYLESLINHCDKDYQFIRVGRNSNGALTSALHEMLAEFYDENPIYEKENREKVMGQDLEFKIDIADLSFDSIVTISDEFEDHAFVHEYRGEFEEFYHSGLQFQSSNESRDGCRVLNEIFPFLNLNEIDLRKILFNAYSDSVNDGYLELEDYYAFMEDWSPSSGIAIETSDLSGSFEFGYESSPFYQAIKKELTASLDVNSSSTLFGFSEEALIKSIEQSENSIINIIAASLVIDLANENNIIISSKLTSLIKSSLYEWVDSEGILNKINEKRLLNGYREDLLTGVSETVENKS